MWAPFLNYIVSGKRGLVLNTDLDPEIPDQLVGDPHRLNQVLINLLGNAIKFTHEGEIQIEVSMRERSGDHAVLSFTITDTGIGIAEESLPLYLR